MSRVVNDQQTRWITGIAAASTTLATLLIICFLTFEAVGVLVDVGVARFFSDSSWHPNVRATDGLYLIFPMIVGTAAVTASAILVALPVGVAIGIFCEFYAPQKLAFIIERILELLAGIPSVVLGLWGLVIVVPVIQQIQGPGVSLLCGALVLSIMIVPIIALGSRAALKSVAEESLRNALALGLSRPTTILQVALPLAKSGILVSALLATARAIGETMVVVMVCGNIARIPHSVFDPVRTLTATIALEMGYSYGSHRGALFFIGLLLMLTVLGLISLTYAFQDRESCE